MRDYFGAEEIQLVYSGNNYFDTLETIISESKQVIHLQTYIFETDETGLKVLGSLKAAARRGVKVYLMIDGYASFPFPDEIARELNSEGVNFRHFSPLLSTESIFIGRRLHHKIIVADKRVGIIGGINIADKYNINLVEKAWLDYAVLIRGDICQYLHLLCEKFYHRKTTSVLGRWAKRYKQLSIPNLPSLVRFRRNDWIGGRNEIFKSYVQALLQAEKDVVIVASYFLPGSRIKKLLRKAAGRGVRVRVMMAGQSDINSLRLAEQYLYDFYLRYGIEVFEWTDSVMHGKAMIVDERWATIGSYNLNLLSNYVSIELNADIIDTGFVKGFARHLDDILTHKCIKIEANNTWKWNNPFARLLRWMAYNVYRLLMAMAMNGRKYRTLMRDKN